MEPEILVLEAESGAAEADILAVWRITSEGWR